MVVKYIISLCLLYSITAENTLSNHEIKDLWDAIRQGSDYITHAEFSKYFNGANSKGFRELINKKGHRQKMDNCECIPIGKYRMNFEEFAAAAKEGLIPTWQLSEIKNLWNAIKSKDKDYITFYDISTYYVNGHWTDDLWNVVQAHGTKRGNKKGGTYNKMNFQQFTKAVNLGQIPRCLVMYNIFRQIIIDDAEDRHYINFNDMLQYYGKTSIYNMTGYQLLKILDKYGEPESNEFRLNFDGWSRAVNLNKLPMPQT